MSKVLVLFYSRTGHTLALARAMAEGAQEVPKTEVRLRRVAENAPEEAIMKNDQWWRTYQEMKEIPVVSFDDLRWMDALILGSPTRFGNMASPIRDFWDQLGPLWVKGELSGKVASMFTSTEMIHGGQEATLLATMPTLFAMGMLLVGVPPTVPELSQAGSYYGATSTGAPNETDLKVARLLARRTAEIAAKLRG